MSSSGPWQEPEVKDEVNQLGYGHISKFSQKEVFEVQAYDLHFEYSGRPINCTYDALWRVSEEAGRHPDKYFHVCSNVKIKKRNDKSGQKFTRSLDLQVGPDKVCKCE